MAIKFLNDGAFIGTIAVQGSGDSYFTGNVGIGTTSPDYKLQVNAGSNIASFKSTGSGENEKELSISSGFGSTILSSKNTDGTGADLAFSTGSFESMRIDSDGNVGIGTNNPTAKFHIRQDDVTVYDPSADDGQRGVGATIQLNNNSLTTNTFGQIMYDTDSSNQAVARIVFLDAGNASSAMAFVTENGDQKGERMRIAADGNVGIGTDTPDTVLHIADSTSPIFTFERLDTTTIANEVIGQFNFKSTDSTDTGVNASIKVIKQGSNAAVPMAITFETGVLGTVDERMRISSAGALRFNAYGAGTLITDASGNITVSSGGGAGGPYLPLAGGTLTGNLAGTTIGLTGGITANHFRTNAGNTGYNLFTRNSTGNTIFVQAAQSNASQPIAKFSYGSATVNAGTAVLQVSKDNSHFVNCDVGIGTTSPSELLHLKTVAGASTDIGLEESGIGWRLRNDQAENDFILSSVTGTFDTFVNRFVVKQDGDATFGGNVKVKSGNKLTLNRADNAIGSELSTDSSGTLILNSLNNQGFEFKNSTTSIFSLAATTGDATFGGNIKLDNFKYLYGDGGNKLVTGYDDGGYYFANTAITSGKIYYGTTTTTVPHVFNSTVGLEVQAGATFGGNVGIGTDSPNSLLSLRKLSATHTILSINRANSDTAALYIGNDSSNNGIISSNNSDLIFGKDFSSVFTERMRIATNGNVGIGTTNPDAKLDIESATNPTIRLTNSTNPLGAADVGTLEFFTKDASTGASRVLSSIVCQNQADSPSVPDGQLVFKTSVGGANAQPATEKMRIDPSGNVGIGTISPKSTLNISQAVSNTPTTLTIENKDTTIVSGQDIGRLDFYANDGSSVGVAVQGRISNVAQNNGNQAGLKFYTYNQGLVEALTINKDGGSAFNFGATFGGNVFIGTTTPGTPNGTSIYGSAFTSSSNGRMILRLASDSTANRGMIIFYNPNGAVGSILTNGSSTTYSTSSDYRLKEDLQDFKGLDMISKIPVYDYKWKTDNTRSYGVMAHELQEVLPDAVSGEKDAEEMQGVDYSKIVPLLIKSIQELTAKVERLEAK